MKNECFILLLSYSSWFEISHTANWCIGHEPSGSSIALALINSTQLVVKITALIRIAVLITNTSCQHDHTAHPQRNGLISWLVSCGSIAPFASHVRHAHCCVLIYVCPLLRIITTIICRSHEHTNQATSQHYSNGFSCSMRNGNGGASQRPKTVVSLVLFHLLSVAVSLSLSFSLLSPCARLAYFCGISSIRSRSTDYPSQPLIHPRPL